MPVVVGRPVPNVIASLNRLAWWKDEQERAESTAHLIAARDQALAGTTTVRVDFEALRAAPADVIRRLADELGLAVTEGQLKAAAESVVKPADVPRDVDPHQRFIDLLLPEVKRNPGDARPVFSLAEVYFHAGDFANARKWFARRLEIDSGESTEEVYWAMLRLGRRTVDAGRYVLAETVARGSMFDTARLHQAGGVGGTDPDPITELARSAAAAGLQTATLDEVLCITTV